MPVAIVSPLFASLRRNVGAAERRPSTLPHSLESST
jgi:hypothetical protein